MQKKCLATGLKRPRSGAKKWTTPITFQEFKAYWQLSEGLIANASKDDLAEVARILAMQAAQYARKYGELQLPDLAELLTATSVDEESVGLLRDGTEALVGVLAIVAGGELGRG